MSDLERRLRAARSRPDESDAPARALATAAAAAGLEDVAYAWVDTPVGRMLVASTARGLVRVALAPGRGDVLGELAGAVSPRVLEDPARLDDVRRQLDEYFSGARTRFDVRVDWRLTSGFHRRVLERTARIPFGSVSTYKDVAAGAGNPRAYRAAGNALGSNPVPIVVPCHRVLATGGSLGGYGGGLPMKLYLLRLEGAI